MPAFRLFETRGCAQNLSEEAPATRFQHVFSNIVLDVSCNDPVPEHVIISKTKKNTSEELEKHPLGHSKNTLLPHLRASLGFSTIKKSLLYSMYKAQSLSGISIVRRRGSFGLFLRILFIFQAENLHNIIR